MNGGVVEEAGFLLSVLWVVEVLHISTELGARLRVAYMKELYVCEGVSARVGEGVSATGGWLR
jgi:hypothetical protein